MARKAWCPSCEEVVELPHRPGNECPTQPWQPENEGGPEPVQSKPYTGPRDDEGRPIGQAVKAGQGVGAGERIPPKFIQPTDKTEK